MVRPRHASRSRVSRCGRSGFVPALLLALVVAAPAAALTEKYRLSWRDDPATTMVIGWVQAGGSDPVVYYDSVDYGQSWAAYAFSASPDRSVSTRGMEHRFARLTGLEPDTAYYFVIRDSESVSERIWFRTAPDSCRPFSFVAGGDSRTNRTPRVNANKLVSKLRPLFVAFGGDYIEYDNDTEWQDWLDDWQSTRSADGRMYPIVAARGNHESNAVVLDIFDSPDPEIYFALGLGGPLIRLYTLNSEITEGGDQAGRLGDDLAANAGQYLFKAAFYHKPMRPHFAEKSEGDAEYAAWAQLFFDNHVDLVVEADTHVTKRTWPIRPSTQFPGEEGFVRDDDAGTVYVGEGGWGAPLKSNDDDKVWTRDSDAIYQIKWVHVGLHEMVLRAIRTDNADEVGTVYDEDPFALPLNLDVWNPSQGETVVLPVRFAAALDDDEDGVPNLCDPCPDDNPDDTDGDGVCDGADLCPGFDDAIGPPIVGLASSLRASHPDRFFWSPVDDATEYRVYLGTIPPEGGLGSRETVYDHACTQVTEATEALVSETSGYGLYCLVAAANPCGLSAAGLGTDSADQPRPLLPFR